MISLGHPCKPILVIYLDQFVSASTGGVCYIVTSKGPEVDWAGWKLGVDFRFEYALKHFFFKSCWGCCLDVTFLSVFHEGPDISSSVSRGTEFSDNIDWAWACFKVATIRSWYCSGCGQLSNTWWLVSRVSSLPLFGAIVGWHLLLERWIRIFIMV